jgi:hypothetical protein
MFFNEIDAEELEIENEVENLMHLHQMQTNETHIK